MKTLKGLLRGGGKSKGKSETSSEALNQEARANVHTARPGAPHEPQEAPRTTTERDACDLSPLSARSLPMYSDRGRDAPPVPPPWVRADASAEVAAGVRDGRRIAFADNAPAATRGVQRREGGTGWEAGEGQRAVKSTQQTHDRCAWPDADSLNCRHEVQYATMRLAALVHSNPDSQRRAFGDTADTSCLDGAEAFVVRSARDAPTRDAFLTAMDVHTRSLLHGAPPARVAEWCGARPRGVSDYVLQTLLDAHPSQAAGLVPLRDTLAAQVAQEVLRLDDAVAVICSKLGADSGHWQGAFPRGMLDAMRAAERRWRIQPQPQPRPSPGQHHSPGHSAPRTGTVALANGAVVSYVRGHGADEAAPTREDRGAPTLTSGASPRVGPYPRGYAATPAAAPAAAAAARTTSPPRPPAVRGERPRTVAAGAVPRRAPAEGAGGRQRTSPPPPPPPQQRRAGGDDGGWGPWNMWGQLDPQLLSSHRQAPAGRGHLEPPPPLPPVVHPRTTTWHRGGSARGEPQAPAPPPPPRGEGRPAAGVPALATSPRTTPPRPVGLGVGVGGGVGAGLDMASPPPSARPWDHERAPFHPLPRSALQPQPQPQRAPRHDPHAADAPAVPPHDVGGPPSAAGNAHERRQDVAHPTHAAPVPAAADGALHPDPRAASVSTSSVHTACPRDAAGLPETPTPRARAACFRLDLFYRHYNLPHRARDTAAFARLLNEQPQATPQAHLDRAIRGLCGGLGVEAELWVGGWGDAADREPEANGIPATGGGGDVNADAGGPASVGVGAAAAPDAPQSVASVRAEGDAAGAGMEDTQPLVVRSEYPKPLPSRDVAAGPPPPAGQVNASDSPPIASASADSPGRAGSPSVLTAPDSYHPSPPPPSERRRDSATFTAGAAQSDPGAPAAAPPLGYDNMVEDSRHSFRSAADAVPPPTVGAGPVDGETQRAQPQRDVHISAVSSLAVPAPPPAAVATAHAPVGTKGAANPPSPALTRFWLDAFYETHRLANRVADVRRFIAKIHQPTGHAAGLLDATLRLLCEKVGARVDLWACRRLESHAYIPVPTHAPPPQAPPVLVSEDQPPPGVCKCMIDAFFEAHAPDARAQAAVMADMAKGGGVSMTELIAQLAEAYDVDVTEWTGRYPPYFQKLWGRGWGGHSDGPAMAATQRPPANTTLTDPGVGATSSIAGAKMVPAVTPVVETGDERVIRHTALPGMIGTTTTAAAAPSITDTGAEGTTASVTPAPFGTRASGSLSTSSMPRATRAGSSYARTLSKEASGLGEAAQAPQAQRQAPPPFRQEAVDGRAEPLLHPHIQRVDSIGSFSGMSAPAAVPRVRGAVPVAELPPASMLGAPIVHARVPAQTLPDDASLSERDRRVLEML